MEHFSEVAETQPARKPTAKRPSQAPHCAPVRNVLGPIPSDFPALVQLGRSAPGKRVVSVIGIVVALPAYPQ